MRTLCLALLLLVFAGLQFRLWKADGLFRENHLYQQKIAEQREHNESLRERNRALAARLLHKDQSTATVEGRARYQLGMIRRDETFVWIIEED